MALDLRLQTEFDADPNAPSEQPGFSTPSANVPEPCADGLSYEELSFLASVASRALSYEQYLKQRLSAACGESAVELGQIADELQRKIDYAGRLKTECLNEFYDAFGEEGETLESYSQELLEAFAAA